MAGASVGGAFLVVRRSTPSLKNRGRTRITNQIRVLLTKSAPNATLQAPKAQEEKLRETLLGAEGRNGGRPSGRPCCT